MDEDKWLLKDIRWSVRPIHLPDSEEYLYDLENISMATVGVLGSLESNRFFEEASQMIANSIQMFQQGYFDAAFYSLRQSIETSIGTLYLTANPDKMQAWNKLEPGFESGKMAKYLRANEPVFMDMASKMQPFFDKVREVQQDSNKYVHKQGYKTFYVTKRITYSDDRLKKVYDRIQDDFVQILKVAIGAVAVYRLAIDPLPVLLMDEDIRLRTGDLLTEPYSQDFVDKYIGQDAIDSYKRTDLYLSHKEFFLQNEKQNDAIYMLIHYQIVDRKHKELIMEQIHLLSLHDRIAFFYAVMSPNISRVFIEGVFSYTTDTKPKNTSMTIGESYYAGIFENQPDYNVQFDGGSFISRFKVGDEFSYVESNEPLSEPEISGLCIVSEMFYEVAQKYAADLDEFLKKFQS